MVYTIPADLLDSIPIDHVYHAALSECATINIDWQDVPKHQQDQRWEAFRRRFNEWRQTPSRSLDASSLSQRLRLETLEMRLPLMLTTPQRNC
jgi:hypothetical protein